MDTMNWTLEHSSENAGGERWYLSAEIGGRRLEAWTVTLAEAEATMREWRGKAGKSAH